MLRELIERAELSEFGYTTNNITNGLYRILDYGKDDAWEAEFANLDHAVLTEYFLNRAPQIADLIEACEALDTEELYYSLETAWNESYLTDKELATHQNSVLALVAALKALKEKE